MNPDKTYHFIIDGEHQSTRIDSVLSLLLPETSRSFLQKLIEDGRLSVNEKICTSKKYKVEEGDVIKVEKLGLEAGSEVTFDQVLLVGDKDVKVGTPTVDGASVKATVVAEGKSKKVIVYRYKRKTGYHKKNGHRQPFTQVKIEKINA